MKLHKSEAAKTVYGVVIIAIIFMFVTITSHSMDDNSLINDNSDIISYLPRFPYHLPLLDVPISDDFSPWARRTGLQRAPDTFLHHIEFRIDQETNWVHTKIGVTSPRFVELEQVIITLHRLPTIWSHINDEVAALQEGRTYFHFHTPIDIFRRNDTDLIQWHLMESGTEEERGELLIFEARIKR